VRDAVFDALSQLVKKGDSACVPTASEPANHNPPIFNRGGPTVYSVGFKGVSAHGTAGLF